MTSAQIFKSVAIHLLWWLVLYAWLAHGIAGAYNLLVAGAVLSVVTFVLMPFCRGNAKLVRPPMLRQIGIASGLLYILVLVWFGHGWLAACSAMGSMAASFWQFQCRKAAGLEG